MLNKRGMSISQRLNEEIGYAEKTKDIDKKKMLAIKALGAADLAVEFGLITYNEWQIYIDRVFDIL